MRGASGDECGNLLGQEYNRPAEAGVLKKPREATLTLTFLTTCSTANCCSVYRQSRGEEPPFIRRLKYAATITSYLGIPTALL
jgi:hypothetical protein